MSAPALRVHHSLGNAFAILMRQLFDELVVLEQDRASRAGGQGVLIVGNRGACRGGQFCVGHDSGVSLGVKLA